MLNIKPGSYLAGMHRLAKADVKPADEIVEMDFDLVSRVFFFSEITYKTSHVNLGVQSTFQNVLVMKDLNRGLNFSDLKSDLSNVRKYKFIKIADTFAQDDDVAMVFAEDEVNYYCEMIDSDGLDLFICMYEYRHLIFDAVMNLEIAEFRPDFMDIEDFARAHRARLGELWLKDRSKSHLAKYRRYVLQADMGI